MMSALVLIRTQTKPHKNIFVSQDLFYLTIVQALHHIFIFIPIVISVFYSKKYLHIYCYEASLPQSTFFVAQWGKKKKIHLPIQEMRVQSLGQEVSLEKKMATSIFRYSCLENPMDRGAWRATVCGVAKNQT